MATISDVAEAAGVSTSTVSYVLSGKRPISAATRARVESAIVSLGYRPHAGARALASSRTNVLALAAPLRADVNVSVIMEFVTGVATQARTYDQDVLLLTTDDVSSIERVSSGSMIDALLMMDIEADDHRIPFLVQMKQPSVLIGVPDAPRGLSCVDLDFEAAGRLAVSHLLGLGHTKIALVGPTPLVLGRHTAYAERMLRGYRRESEQAGVETVIELSEASQPGGRDALDAALARVPDLSALVVHNEAALPGVLGRLQERGLRVPEDVSVLALCPVTLAEAQPVPLTSIDIPATTIGRLAVDMAMSRVLGDGLAETRLLTPQVVERASTAPLD